MAASRDEQAGVTPERWVQIEELFQRAAESSPAERSQLLDEAGSSDPELRREVESLLSCQPSAAEHLRAAIYAVGPPGQREEFQGTERFVVQHRLGEGGFGVVYQVYDRQQDATVALKTLPEVSAEALYHFKREFRGLASTVHRNLVMLYELLSDNQQWFFTMELVDGVNFIQYVKHDKEHGFDVDRLRAALTQLVEGVFALHQTGRLHRDLKPSNVLVAKDGRVVILDFGLAIEIASKGPDATGPIMGTPGYMSPEQAAGLPLSEASDWYSVGVLLYEALTGGLPFGSRSREAPALQHDAGIPPPSLPAGEVPEGLDRLCSELLGRDPSGRPSGRDLLRRLGGQEGVAAGDNAALPPITSEAPFVGREEELAELRKAFEAVQTDRAAVAYIHGGSGAGKSALAGHFLEELRTRDAAAVFSGRCYERESVPYKALDSLVDALTQHLTGLPHSALKALAPSDIGALIRLFPVLERVESFAEAGQRASDTPDPHELRQRAFAAFRELLRRLARRKPLVLFIDDCQWGDADSAALLAGLLRPPDPPSVLWIACYRSEEAETSPLLRGLFASHSAAVSEVYVTRLALKELSCHEARDLALRLLPQEHRATGRAEMIAEESGGNPFFIYELARSTGESARTSASLDDTIRVRASRLPEAARHLLELVAVAGQPIALKVVKSAARIHGEEESVVGILRAAYLVRTRKTEERSEIETYHDRTREAVGESLSPQIWKAHHWALASELEASDRADPETLATHFRGAGELAKAAGYAVTAGDRASAALAFDRAAGLYRTALELGADGSTLRLRLRERLGDALTNAGRGGEAAGAYLGAAEGMTGVEKLELQRRAAAQLLLSGRIDEGLNVARGVLKALGVKIAKTMHRSLLRFLFWRACIEIRGLRFREPGAGPISAEDRTRIDTCFSLFQGLTMVDSFWSHEFHARNLLYSLRSGDLYRIARALVSEAGIHALPGGRNRQRAEKLLETATKVAERSGNPHAAGLAALQAGVCAFVQGQWRECRARMEHAEATLRKHCTGVAWELATSHLMGSVSLFFLGELKVLCGRLPALLAEAEARDDLYQGTDLRSRLSHVVHLAADQPEQAYEELHKALSRWPQQHYHLQHWWALVARLEIDFYCGRGRAAWAEVSKEWGPLRRTLLMRIQYVRILSLHHRACAALALAADPSVRTADRSELLSVAEADARRIGREKMNWGSGLALLVRAGVAAGRRDREESARLLRSAEAILETADMMLYAVAARRLRGELLADDQGRTLVVEADAWMSSQQIRNPVRMAAMLAPGVGLWASA